MNTPPDEHEVEEHEVDEELEDFTEEEETFVEEEEEEEKVEEPVAAQPLPQKPVKVDEIPLEIVVEAGRFQMTAQKLLELQPGSLINLEIHPEQGVDLVVNGTCIAKGELLKVGETLGVRILDIAK